MRGAAGWLVVVMLCISSAARAQASGWGASFAPAPVASWVTGNKPRVLVVAAGDASDVADAERRLVGALRDGGRASLVMTDEALGDIAGLGDSDIVKKATAFPVDQVAVLRVFPGADAPTAVVTFYGADGKVLSAFTAQRGTVLAEKAASDATGRGVSKEAANAVTDVTKSVPSSDDVMEEYEKSYIGFEDFARVNANSGAVLSTHSVPYQGKYKKPLEGAAFYQAVGRLDLAEQYRQRFNTRTAMGIGGILGIVAGAAVIAMPLITETCSMGSPEFSACTAPSLYIGGGMIAGGAVLALMTGSYNPDPVTPSEARELADKYNKSLKTRLNLAADESKPAPSRDAFTLAVSPVFGRDGAGISVRGTF